MQFQTNPYIIWQIIPALINAWLGIYILSRPRKKPESNILSLLLFAGAFWSGMNAIQLASPNFTWQSFWYTATFLPIVIVPSAIFLLAVEYTGFYRGGIKKVQTIFLVVPTLTYLALLTNVDHKLFISSFEIITINELTELAANWGPLFYFHTFYSYALIVTGVLFLGISLAKNFKNRGTQAYGLIFGVLIPLVINIFYLFGSLPPSFPDPTPMSFTITGITFAWAIFTGRMLDVVPIAHESIVASLANGIIVLNLENKILDINPAALGLLNLPATALLDRPLPEFLSHDSKLLEMVQAGLNKPPALEQLLWITTGGTKKTYELRITGIQDKHDLFTGRLLQFTDISAQRKVEENLTATKESLASILDTLKDYYFETDINGIVTNINKAFCEHLGYSRKEDVVGKHFRHFTHRESARQVFENFKRVFIAKETIDLFQYSYRTKDGSTHIGETTITPLIEGDIVIGARGVLRDITDRVKGDELLRLAKEDVEARAKDLVAINRIAMISNQSLNLNNILQALCVELTKIFPVRNAGIGLITPNKESLEVVAFHSIDPNESSALGIFLPFEGNSASQEVIEEKKTVVIQNSQEDPRMKLMADLSKARGTKAIMIVPLLTRGNAIGTIGMPAKDPEHIFDEKEIRFAEIIASQIAAAIDNAQLYAKTELALGFAEQDLEIGRQIQSGFFPEKIPEIPGWETAAHFEGARQVAGDFYDFFQFENSKLMALVIADVCDKGVGAALFMVVFRSLLRAFSKIDINSRNVSECLKTIIANTNNYIAKIHENSNMFATVFFGILDPESGILYYANGGHEPPAILDRGGKIIARLRPTGPAVGLFPEAIYQVKQLELSPGDFLVGYTDGTTDAQNAEGSSFSEERLLKYIQAPWSSLFSMVFELRTELQNYMGGQKQFDDIALISIRRKINPEVERHAICRVAEIGILRELSDFVIAAAEQCELNQDVTYSFKKAAEEVCTNIIMQGFEDSKPGFISLSFEKDAISAKLIIRDDGKHFSPDTVLTTNLANGLEEIHTGSLANISVKDLMDHVSYSRMKESGNQLILEKNIRNQSERVVN